MNAMYLHRLAKAGEALKALDGIGATVLAVDVNRACPVIEIAPAARNRHLGTAYAYCLRPGPHGRIKRFQVQHAGCRIEWDVHGH